jgi:hypothetical protein
MAPDRPMTDNLIISQRELWLSDAVTRLRPYLLRRGLRIPDRVAVQVGITQICDNGLPALGQCSPRAKSEGGFPRILINDQMSNPLRLLDVLLHECIHTADNCRSGHGEWFQAWARHLGLRGCPGTWAGSRLKTSLVPMARALGPYPSADKRFVIDSGGRPVA